MKLFAMAKEQIDVKKSMKKEDIDGGGCDYLAKMSLNCAMDHG